MKRDNPRRRQKALERLYQKALRLLQEDEAKYDADLDPEFDDQARATAFVASMSPKTLTLLNYHVLEQHGNEAHEEFTWLMPALAGMLFTADVAFRKAA